MEYLLAFFAGFMVCFGVFVSAATPDTVWQKEAIERDYGLYCPSNGEWAWKGECVNE